MNIDDSYIKNTVATSNFYIESALGIYLRTKGGTETALSALTDGGVNLFYDNNLRLSTYDKGIKLSANGTVGGVSSGYRTLTDGAFNFTDTFMNTWLPRDSTRTTFSWAMLMKDVDRANDHAYFSWIGGTSTARADAAIYVSHTASIGSTNLMFQHFAGNAYMPASGTVQTMAFAPGTNTYVWLCHWLDGSAFYAGWTESATEHASPTAYSDFPSTQRFQANTTAAANKNYWNYNPLYFYSYGAGGKGIGFNNGNARGNFKLKKFVASKLPIAE